MVSNLAQSVNLDGMYYIFTNSSKTSMTTELHITLQTDINSLLAMHLTDAVSSALDTSKYCFFLSVYV